MSSRRYRPCASWIPQKFSVLSPTFSVAVRSFSDDKNNDKDKDASSVVSDPFGVNFDDGPDGLGPSKPPSYKRDAMTGRFTGEIVPESTLTDADKRLLDSNPVESDQIFTDHIEEHWKKNPDELNDLGQRVRESKISSNVFGRSPKAQAAVESMEDGVEMGRDDQGFSQKLTHEEMRTFKQYMKKEHDINVAEDDLPTQAKPKPSFGASTSGETDPESRELALKWLTARAQRQMDDSLDDNPYSDMVPGDLTPTRLVNRKRAKRIPVKLLHHNNLALLRTFISDAGLIRHRVQTRLGARDQRKVAKLVKRARALGLLPHAGQFKVSSIPWCAWAYISSPFAVGRKSWLGQRT